MHNFRNFRTVFQKTMPKLCQKLCQNIHFKKIKNLVINSLYYKTLIKSKKFRSKNYAKTKDFILTNKKLCH